MCHSCAYNYREILVGSGMMTPVKNIVPAPCYSCKRLIKVDLVMQELKCSRCRKEVTPFKPFLSDNEDLYTDEMKFKCPKCGEKELQILFVGLWD